MRIDRLTIQNFKKFAEQSFALHPQFTLLVGENGSGKTTVLDALAVSLGIWLVEVPDSSLINSHRNILTTEIRLEPSQEGDRIQFREKFPVLVQATGQIGDQQSVTWVRQIKHGGKRSNAGAKEALDIIKNIYKRDESGESIICPMLAYYGAARAGLPSNKRKKDEPNGGLGRRWAAFYDCLTGRIRLPELTDWFKRETIAAVNRKGRLRPSFEIVKRAVLDCVPGADDVWFDPDREQVVLSIAGQAQPFDNLSAGQRMMLALVADIAIKAVTQNAFLVPRDELGPEDEPLPRLLQQTPGVVLIDELDVHLHPSWQRRVAADLKRTFPAIQFVCTSHSPQVIGELEREEVKLLRPEGIESPPVARGADSNWILDHVMEGSASENLTARQLKDEAEDALAEGNLPQAHAKLEAFRCLLDGDTGELIRLESSLYTLEALAEDVGEGENA
ncbi:MAG: AAA family ATPase [Planctomycetaceae bacterium]